MEEENNEWAMLNNPSGIHLIVELQATGSQGEKDIYEQGLFVTPLLMPHTMLLFL